MPCLPHGHGKQSKPLGNYICEDHSLLNTVQIPTSHVTVLTMIFPCFRLKIYEQCQDFLCKVADVRDKMVKTLALAKVLRKDLEHCEEMNSLSPCSDTIAESLDMLKVRWVKRHLSNLDFMGLCRSMFNSQYCGVCGRIRSARRYTNSPVESYFTFKRTSIS